MLIAILLIRHEIFDMVLNTGIIKRYKGYQKKDILRSDVCQPIGVMARNKSKAKPSRPDKSKGSKAEEGSGSACGVSSSGLGGND